MTKFFLCIITCLLIYPLLMQAAVGKSRDILPGPIPAKVIRVIDGDTLHVRAKIWIGQEIEIRVRIKDIDTPEISGLCTNERIMGQEAKIFVENHIKDHQIQLTNIHQGKYSGRIIANVTTTAGVDIGEKLLTIGLAKPYFKRRYQKWCSEYDY